MADIDLGTLLDGRVASGPDSEVFHLMHAEERIGYRDYKQVAVILHKRTRHHDSFGPAGYAASLSIWVQMPAGDAKAQADLTANDLRALRVAIDNALDNLEESP